MLQEGPRNVGTGQPVADDALFVLKQSTQSSLTLQWVTGGSGRCTDVNTIPLARGFQKRNWLAALPILGNGWWVDGCSVSLNNSPLSMCVRREEIQERVNQNGFREVIFIATPLSF